MESYKIRLLGAFEVYLGDRLLIERSWSRRKAQALIKLIAMTPGHALHREEVLDRLWEEMEPAAATNNLHKVLHHIRTRLTADGATQPLVLLSGEMVQLAPGTEVDVERFQAAAREALASRDAPRCEEAAAFYRGDLLPEDIYEEWAAPERDSLRQLYTQLVLGLARVHESEGQDPAGIDALQRLLRADPLNEEAHYLLMRLFARSGSRHRALRQFQVLRDLLARELQTEPSPEAIRLHDELLQAASGTGVEPLTPSVSTTQEDAATWPAQIPAYGRERELEAADEALEAAADGHGSVLLVRGEAGIGKTHYLLEVLATARESGYLVLSSRCARLESSVAYQPFRDLLQQAAVAGVLENVPRSLYLRRLLFAEDERDEGQRDTQRFQTELFGEAYRMVQSLAAQQPLLIHVDDLHDADEDSVKLLHYLARRIAGDRVIIAASYRPEDSPQNPRIAEMGESLRRERIVTEVNLEPLDERAMTLLVERLFGGEAIDAQLLREVIDRAEGNPLFAGELVHTFVEEGWARQMDGRWQRRGSDAILLPSAVTELLDIRFNRLGHAAQEVLRVASSYGREFDYDILSHTVSIPEQQALDALDECIEAFIIEETREGYRFRHQLLREAIYERLTRARRQTLHRTLARVLESRRPENATGPQPELIGHHYDLSDEPWRAVPYLMESARRAASVFANEHAIGLYERALSLAEAHPHTLASAQTAELMETLGDLQRRHGNAARSAELFLHAYTLFQEGGNAEDATRARGKAALGYIVDGRYEPAKELIDETLRELSAQSPQYVVARTHYLLAQLHWHSGENEGALRAAEAALAAADASGDPAERAQAREVLALACHSLGDWRRGVQIELERQSLGYPGFDTDESFEAHL